MVAAGAGALALESAAVAAVVAGVPVLAGVAGVAGVAGEAAAAGAAAVAAALPLELVRRVLGILPWKVFRVWIASRGSLGSTTHALLHIQSISRDSVYMT